MEADLDWIRPDEEANVAAVRSELRGINDAPEDLTHDIVIARFLRGHNNDVATAASFMKKATEHRMPFLEQDSVKAMRARMDTVDGSDLRILDLDLAFGHQASAFKQTLPYIVLKELTPKRLPVALSRPAMFSPDLILKAMDSGKLEEWNVLYLEWRSLLLHKMSLSQRRMVKFVEVRDMTHLAVLQFLWSSGFLVKRFMGIMRQVADFYPEQMFLAYVHNASPSFSSLFAVISPSLNERIKAKIRVQQFGACAQIANALGAAALNNWITQLLERTGRDLESFAVDGGGEEYAVLWLAEGEEATWTLTVCDKSGGDAAVRVLFLPSVAEEGTSAEAMTVSGDGSPSADFGRPARGKYVAPSDGVFWFCATPSGRWRNGSRLSLHMALSFSC
jgi:hypothetical protein